MTADQARARFAAARLARLATVDAQAGQPHLVPITFAVLGPDEIVFAVDHKPKRTRALRRLRNIESNPQVSVLVDAYDDADWSRLWWARADGRAAVVGAAERPEAIRALVGRYRQYAERPPEGPLVVIAVGRWSGWSAG